MIVVTAIAGGRLVLKPDLISKWLQYLNNTDVNFVFFWRLISNMVINAKIVNAAIVRLRVCSLQIKKEAQTVCYRT